jgi:hypothetical protein
MFVIDTLLKDNRQSHIQPSRAIVVTRPGGTITINGDPVSIRVEVYPALIPNTAYLLFLH